MRDHLALDSFDTDHARQETLPTWRRWNPDSG
jgi:hypothetical protein